MTKASKQKSIRFSDEVREKVEQLAVEEGRTFSGQVNWLLRTMLAQRAFAKKPSQQHAA
jgi:predicted DNA-binding protein